MDSLETVTRTETFPGMNLPKKIWCKLCLGEPLVYDAADQTKAVILKEWDSLKAHLEKAHNVMISRITATN